MTKNNNKITKIIMKAEKKKIKLIQNISKNCNSISVTLMWECNFLLMLYSSFKLYISESVNFNILIKCNNLIHLIWYIFYSAF